MSQKSIAQIAVPDFDKWRLDQEHKSLTATINQLVQAQRRAVEDTNEAVKELYDRMRAIERAHARLDLLLTAIQKDLPAITKNCPNVLAVAANIAIEDGGLDKE